MITAIDEQADALLCSVIEDNGGDMRAALLALCACVSLADIFGETYEQALARAVGALFQRPPFVRLQSRDPASPEPLQASHAEP